MEEKQRHIINEDWTDSLRDKLDGFEVAAPEGLWEQIEGSLPQQQPHSRLVISRWMRAAAAVILLLATGAAYWYISDNSDINKKVARTENMHKADMETGGMPVTVETGLQQTAGALYAYTAKTQISVAEGNFVAMTDAVTEDIQILQDNGDVDAEKDNSVYIDGENALASGKTVQETVRYDKAYRQKQQAGYRQAYGKIKHGGKITAGLYAANIMTDNRASANGVMMSANVMNINYNDNKGIRRAANNPLYLANYKEETKHRLPVSVGLSVSYGLTDRLWMESGAVYTKLSSNFTRMMNNDAVVENRTLHYIGIPLNVGYTVYRKHGFNVYGVAGGQADINVKAKCEIECGKTDVEKDRVQWSVKAAAGVQYDIVPQLGVYAESGVKFYPDNGSNVDNIFKDKNVNFSLQFGVRYKIK